MKSYADKLKDPRWQKRRLEIMQRDKFRCRRCMDDATTLNVHHLIYDKGKSPWDYPDDLLVTLCEKCHVLAEDRTLKILKAHLSLTLCHPVALQHVLVYLRDFCGATMTDAFTSPADEYAATMAAEGILLSARDGAMACMNSEYELNPIDRDEHGNPTLKFL